MLCGLQLLLLSCLAAQLAVAFLRAGTPAIQTRCRSVARAPIRLHSLSSAWQAFGFPLADLDAETLDALGDINELNDALDGVVDNAINPTVGILTKLSASPLIVAVPILAGILVAFGFGFFVFSYGQGKEE